MSCWTCGLAAAIAPPGAALSEAGKDDRFAAVLARCEGVVDSDGVGAPDEAGAEESYAGALFTFDPVIANCFDSAVPLSAADAAVSSTGRNFLVSAKAGCGL